ncbi:MAG: TIM barrel protein [Clostridia bacterium]
MSETKFGPAGNDQLFYDEGNTSSLQAPKWIANLGLNLFEYSFGSGINISDANARLIGEEAKKYGIEMSVHAPYYINFASVEPELVEKSFMYVTKSLEKLKIFGGKNCVVHMGSTGRQRREEAFEGIMRNLDILLEKVEEKGLSDLYICPETMGKNVQIGTVDEIVEFCKKGKNLVPTFDFGHINCIGQGSLKTKQDYEAIFEKALNNLDEEKVKNCHIHFSKIQYGPKGELKHLTLEDNLYGPPFEPLAEAIIELRLTPSIICECKGKMAIDAVTMQKIYNSLKNN